MFFDKPPINVSWYIPTWVIEDVGSDVEVRCGVRERESEVREVEGGGG